jgi:deoxycytidine triphosphate deaminase
MFINPRLAIENGWVKGIKNEKIQVQPNALDFTLDRIDGIKHDATFILCADPANPEKELKQHRGAYEIAPIPDRATGVQFYHLYHGSYDCTSDVYVELPEGVAAMTVVRSTLCRNGFFITSGLYDTGFKGHVGFVLQNRSGQAKIEQGSRVGQLIFVEASNAGVYAGGYNHEKGTAAPHL